MIFSLIIAGAKGVGVPLPCVSQGVSHAKETYSALKNPQLRETTHVR